MTYTLHKTYLPTDGNLLWCWYWQNSLFVSEMEEGASIVLPSGQTVFTDKQSLQPSWLYSSEITGLNPYTYAHEHLWQGAVVQVLRNADLTLLALTSSGNKEYRIPWEKTPNTEDLAMTWMLRRGYTLKEKKGEYVTVITPGEAERIVRRHECTCQQAGMCPHRRLVNHYLRHRATLKLYPELASLGSS